MTPEEIKKYTEDNSKLFEEFKSAIESKMADTAEGKEKIATIEAKFDKLEETNQTIMTDSKKAEDEAKEFKEKIVFLEKQLTRMPGGAGGVSITPEAKAFAKLVKEGKEYLSVEEKAYLRTDVGPDGGFLVPEEMSDEIVKKITEVSPMRQIARIKQTSSKSYVQPVRTSNMTPSDVGEGGTAGDTIQQYGEVEIFTKKMMAVIPLTMEIIQDSAFNMDNEVITDAREVFEQKEGQWFVTGAGALQAKGFMNNAKISSVSSGIADSFDSDNLIELTGELKVGYNPVFTFKRQTLSTIRRFKTGDGQYLWVPAGSTGLAPGAPNEINGEQYVIMQDMPSIGAGLEPVAYGDFKRGYLIIDRIGITMIRDEFTLAEQGKVRFVITRRVGGDVILPEAIVKLKCEV